MVQQYFAADPTTGHLFIFFNRTFKMVKILDWDGDSYAILTKRLAQDQFILPKSADGKIELASRELYTILSGIQPKRYYKRFSLKKIDF